MPADREVAVELEAADQRRLKRKIAHAGRPSQQHDLCLLVPGPQMEGLCHAHYQRQTTQPAQD